MDFDPFERYDTGREDARKMIDKSGWTSARDFLNRIVPPGCPAASMGTYHWARGFVDGLLDCAENSRV
jgi:hypothetical protein